jgi:hypothetical protein
VKARHGSWSRRPSPRTVFYSESHPNPSATVNARRSCKIQALSMHTLTRQRRDHERRHGRERAARPRPHAWASSHDTYIEISDILSSHKQMPDLILEFRALGEARYLRRGNRLHRPACLTTLFSVRRQSGTAKPYTPLRRRKARERALGILFRVVSIPRRHRWRLIAPNQRVQRA